MTTGQTWATVVTSVSSKQPRLRPRPHPQALADLAPPQLAKASAEILSKPAATESAESATNQEIGGSLTGAGKTPTAQTARFALTGTGARVRPLSL